jgi:hypothetical protein
VHNVAVVEVFYSSTYLDEKTTNLWHSEIGTFPQGVGQGAILTKLKDDIRAFYIGEGAVEFDNVGVVQLRVELELGDKLHAASTFVIAAVTDANKPSVQALQAACLT